MILSSTQKIQAVLAGAVSANQPTFRCDFIDMRTDATQPGSQTGELDDTTAVDIVDAPSAMWNRDVKEMQIYNADTANVTVTVSIDDNGTSTTIGSAVLAAGETLSYAEGEFSVLRGSRSWLWDESADHALFTGDATFADNVAITGTVTVGVDATGHDVKFYGDTTGKYWLWDQSEDRMYVVGASQFTGDTVHTGKLTVGVNDTGHDVKFFGATAGKYMEWDEDADQFNVVGTAKFTGVVTHSTATAGLIAGAGADGATHALGSTAGNALSYYLTATHTTGDMRGLYLALSFDGTGGSGEAVRGRSIINNKTVATGGTVNAAHFGIATAGASAAVAGQASAVRATFEVASASTTLGGTCSVLILDTLLPTEITVPTNMAFIRIANLGAKKANAFLRLAAPVAETAGIFCAHTVQTVTHSIRIVDDAGKAYYIMCTDVDTNRTVS